MTTPLTSEERSRYTDIIDDILKSADLETISRKKIRQGLETELGGKDLTDQKAAIKKLIEARFDAFSGASAPEPDPAPIKRSASHATSDAGETDPSASPEPARKKAKRSSSVEDADARLAAQLQAQENSLARSRKTRGGGDKAKTKASRKQKAAPRKKSSKKVDPKDDSDVESGEGVVKKRKAGGGFMKPFNLSPALSELTGETQLSRPQVVKKLWEHIKSNELQDPKDKRQILCDEKMQAVFKQAKVDMFRMNKDIGHHLYPVEVEEE